MGLESGESSELTGQRRCVTDRSTSVTNCNSRRQQSAPAEEKAAAAAATMIKALRNLQTALDEGFVTKQEFEKRKKAIIDGATALPNEPRAAKGKAAKGSVFDRLGEVEAGVDGNSWGHGGYDELYGPGAAAKASRGKQQARVTPHGKAAGAKRTVIAKGNGGDLRDKLSGGIRKPVRGRGGVKALPEKCPW